MSTQHRGRLTRARLVLAGFGWRVFLRRYRGPLFVFVLLIGLAGSLAAVGVLATSDSSSSSAGPAAKAYATTLGAIPTNRVTGSGSVTVQLKGLTATVTMDTNGLLNGSPHLAHIHGEGLGTCPTAANARLHNGHLSISTGDAIRLYGSTLTSFTLYGSTSGAVPTNIDMNLYPASGNIRYKRTMRVSRLVADLVRDGDGVIVVHGIDYNENHVYDFSALGVSDLDHTLPGEATAPALCGPLRRASSGHSASAANGTTFVASLRTTPPIDGSGVSTGVPAAATSSRSAGHEPPSAQSSLICDLSHSV